MQSQYCALHYSASRDKKNLNIRVASLRLYRMSLQCNKSWLIVLQSANNGVYLKIVTTGCSLFKKREE